MTVAFLHKCGICGATEERVLKDSWTGKQMCLSCVSEIVNYLTNSPCSEKDNFESLIEEMGLI